MPVKEILMLGNPLLREKSSKVKELNNETNRIIFDLEDTLKFLQREKGVGRALAAPQIGYLKRILYANLLGRQIFMINPAIVKRSKDTFEVWDSCFSFDVAFFVKIKRYKQITVEYLDENFEERKETFTGDLSELFQHEIDHHDGILAIDRLADVSNIIMKNEWEKIAKT